MSLWTVVGVLVLTLTKEAQNKRRSFLERCHSSTFLTGAASHMMEWLQCRLVVRGYPVVVSAGLPCMQLPGECFGCA
jgi:hypothetical protein